MAYKDFYNEFNKDLLGNVVFLCGAEDYLNDWAVDLIVNKYLSEEDRSLDLVTLDGSNCSAGDIMSAARAYSMFSPKRVVVVQNFVAFYRKTDMATEDKLLEFAKQAVKDNDSSILVFQLDAKHSADINAFGKKMLKECKSYEFASLDKAELKAFISKRVHQAGNMIGNRELDYMIDLSGYFNKNSEYHLDNIVADLERINNACDNNQISKTVIEDLLVGEEDKFVFNLVDALMNGDKKTAMKLATTIANESADGVFPVIGLLTKQFEIMYDAIELDNAGMSMGQMVKATGVNEFRFKKAYHAARGFRPGRVKKLLIELYNIDKNVKNGNMDVETAFELFVVTV